jgi:hypothetical protein
MSKWWDHQYAKSSVDASEASFPFELGAEVTIDASLVLDDHRESIAETKSDVVTPPRPNDVVKEEYAEVISSWDNSRCKDIPHRHDEAVKEECRDEISSLDDISRGNDINTNLSNREEGYQIEDQGLLDTNGTEDMNWDGVSLELKEGLTFISRTQVKEFIALYEAKDACKMIVVSGGASEGCTSKKIVFGCCYGYQRPSIATDKRPGAHSKKKGCSANIRFYCGYAGTDDQCKITSFEEKHNHIRTLKMFEQEIHKIDSEEEKLWLKDASSLNVKPNQIKNFMKMKYGKASISTKHIRYMQNKLIDPDTDRNELATCLENIEDEGGRVEVLYDKNLKVRCLVVQTVQMKRAYAGVSPDVCQVDTTFGFETSGYKMSCFMYLNPICERGEVAQIAFMADEKEEVYKFVFNAFKNCVKRDPPIILVDKDFNSIRILREVFKSTTVLLCLFHVLKWWKAIIKTSKNDVMLNKEDKGIIMEAFRDVVYASEENIKDRKDKFEELIKNVEVRIGNGDQAYHRNLQEYYSSNWDECSTMWMMMHRKNLVGVEDEHTNNRLERFWRSCKDFLRVMSSGAMTIVRAVYTTLHFVEDRMDEKYAWDLRHTMRMFDEDPDVKEEYAVAANEINDRGLRKFKKSVDLMRKRFKLMEVCDSNEGEVVKEIFKEATEVQEVKSNQEQIGEEVNEDGFDDWIDEADLNDNFKIYKTTTQSCNCTWIIRAGSPCRHVLLVRKVKGLRLFDVSLFNERFLKQRNEDLLSCEKGGVEISSSHNICRSNDISAPVWPYMDKDEDMEKDERVPEQSDLKVGNALKDLAVDDPLDDGANSKTAMNRGEKYGVVGPQIERLLESMLRCGTRLVHNYSNELEICLNNVRNGRSLFFRDEKLDDLLSQEMSELGDPAASNNNTRKKKYDLNWHTSMKVNKVGRPKESKTSFDKVFVKKIKKNKQKNSSSSKVKKARKELDATDTPIICSHSQKFEKPRNYAIYEKDLDCLAPRRFVSDNICEFMLKTYQPQGPAGETVWILSNSLGQQLAGRYWENPLLRKQLEEARLYEEDGCNIVFLPWCEQSHFFAIIAVCGAQDKIFVCESIGNYEVPAGVGVLQKFLSQVRSSKLWDPVDCIIKTLESPKQDVNSNDCAIMMLKTARMLLQDPEDFCERAENNDLLTWYTYDQVRGGREDIVNTMVSLGERQRLPGGLLEKEETLDLLVPTFPYQVICIQT